MNSQVRLEELKECQDKDFKEDPILRKYTWLVWDQQTQLYQCRACKEAGCTNMWAKGKALIEPNRADEHINSMQHLRASKGHLKLPAIEEVSQPTLQETLASSGKAIQNEEILSIFRNVYFVAKSNLPLSILEGDGGLHHLTELNQGTIQSHYRSRRQATEILGFISDNILLSKLTK
jgi:hypothetical protein